MTRALFTKLLVRFVLLLLGVILVIALSFAFGSRASLLRWSARAGERLEGRVARELELIAKRPGALTPVEVEQALRGLMVPGVLLRVYDPAGNLVIGFQGGAAFVPLRPVAERRMQQERQPPMADRQRFAPPDLPLQLEPSRLQQLRPVSGSDGRPILYFVARSEGFLMDEPNRILFRSVLIALGVGLAAAALLATLGAWGLSRNLARSTGAISRALSRVAEGKRDVVIERGDVRELNQIATDTEHLQQELVREERLRGQWAQDVAHDLRTPITALRAQLEGVRDGVLSTGPRRIDIMMVQLDRIERLVASLNELTRLESPDTRFTTQTVAVGDLCRYVCETVRPLIESAGQGSICAQEAGAGAVRVEQELFTRACANLVDNAIRYRNSGTPVAVIFVTVQDRFQVIVRNQGALPAEPERLFERLVRGEQSRSSEGTGLGLTIARAIAGRHGGSVELHEPSPGHVEAILTIPLASG